MQQQHQPSSNQAELRSAQIYAAGAFTDGSFCLAAAVSNKLLFPKHTSFQSFYSLLCYTLNPHDF